MVPKVHSESLRTLETLGAGGRVLVGGMLEGGLEYTPLVEAVVHDGPDAAPFHEFTIGIVEVVDSFGV